MDQLLNQTDAFFDGWNEALDTAARDLPPFYANRILDLKVEK